MLPQGYEANDVSCGAKPLCVITRPLYCGVQVCSFGIRSKLKCACSNGQRSEELRSSLEIGVCKTVLRSISAMLPVAMQLLLVQTLALFSITTVPVSLVWMLRVSSRFLFFQEVDAGEQGVHWT
jgi:hypothetical protein